MQEFIAKSITTQAGLIGWYRGYIKGILNGLNEIPDKDKDEFTKAIITTLKESLEIGQEIWERVKHN